MADYFSPTIIQQTIPVADMTPLERLLLSHIFSAEPDGDGLYFCADERPADMIWLDRTQLETALAQSETSTDSTHHRLRHQATRTSVRRRHRNRTRSQRHVLGINLPGHRAPLDKPALRHGRLVLHLLEDEPRPMASAAWSA